MPRTRNHLAFSPTQTRLACRENHGAVIAGLTFALIALSISGAIASPHHRPSRHVKPDSSSCVVREACALQGARYRMGGVSRSGFDCSGFVRYILGNAVGVSLPRTAVEQYYHGVSIAVDALKPGDLVFFRDTYRRGISHVGIFIGNGQFIHAANAREGVRVDRLSDSYYCRHYAGARRVLSRD